MTVTLLEAHERFAAKLDELRHRRVVEFDVWLKSALDENPDPAQAAVRDRLAIERKKFVDEFLDQHAPVLLHELNPGAEREILKALRSYEAKPEPKRPPPAAPAERRWQPSLWRMALAAAFGAVVAVILLALQPIGEAPKGQPPAKNEQSATAVTPSAPAGPNEEASPPPKEQPPVTITREKLVLWLIAAAFAA